MKNINIANINVNNTIAHLNALTKQREELVKKLTALDEEIKETRKTIEVKQGVLKLQKEYADKVAALKKEYDNKIKALVGDDNTPDPDPQPESPKLQPKAQAKETAVPKATAPVEKKTAPAPKKEEKVASATLAPSEKKETVKAHNKSQFLHEISVDHFQKVINEIPKEEAAEAILHAKINGTKEQIAILFNAVIYGYQNGVRKFWFTYSAPELLAAVSKEMGEILEVAERYNFTVKVTQRAAAAPKTQTAQNVAAPAASSVKADRTQTAAPKASQAPAKKSKEMAVNPDGFRAWTLANAAVVDGSDEI